MHNTLFKCMIFSYFPPNIFYLIKLATNLLSQYVELVIFLISFSRVLLIEMAAVINKPPTSNSIGSDAKFELIQKVEGQVARITDLYILSGEDEGFVLTSEDKTLKVLLKRESGQFWPSTIQDLPSLPTKLICDEKFKSIFVGMVNGVVYEYTIESDFNSISFKRQWIPHTGPVTGLYFSGQHQQMVSCSKDKTILWFNTDTTRRIGSYSISSPCTALQFEIESKFVFVGDYSGNIHILRLLSDNTANVVSKLSAHTGSISDLCWDRSRQFLYSASTDSLIIVWDIGGKRGTCYELSGHTSKLTSLAFAVESRRLFSADESGHVVCWDMRTNRTPAPSWRDTDKCELCDAPFFWNFMAQFERKTVGVRRHHCRTCGQSLCSSCCNYFSTFPSMGFEKPARMCKTCHEKIERYPEQFDMTSLAVTSDLRRGVSILRFQENRGLLVTVGFDRTIMMWNASKML